MWRWRTSQLSPDLIPICVHRLVGCTYKPRFLPTQPPSKSPRDWQGQRAVSDALDSTSTNCPYKAKLGLSGDGPTDKWASILFSAIIICLSRANPENRWKGRILPPQQIHVSGRRCHAGPPEKHIISCLVLWVIHGPRVSTTFIFHLLHLTFHLFKSLL